MNVYECLWISCTGLSNATQRVGNFGATSAIRSIYVYLAMYFFPDVLLVMFTKGEIPNQPGSGNARSCYLHL